MGRTWDRIKASFGVPSGGQFNYESPAYSILLHGMFGQAPNGRGSLSGRTEAMEIPAVARGRNLICSIATLPLEEIDSRNVVQSNPLLEQLDPNVPNVVTMAQTLEDLLFDAVAWWRITGFDPATGMPSQIKRMEPGQVSLQAPANYRQGWLPSNLPVTGVVWVDGKPVPHSEMIRFDSPNRPLMEVARRAVLRAISLDLAAQKYADNPRPGDYFAPRDPVNGDPMSQDEVSALLADWLKARQAGTTAYIPAALTYQSVQQPTPADIQLVQLQQRVSLDIANMIGLDAEELGISTTSRVYQNDTDRRQDRINDLYAPYMRAVTDRLAMPDVTVRGNRVRFSLTDFLRADPKTRAEVSEIGLRNGWVTREHVARVVEGLPPEAIPPAPPGERQPAIDAGEVQVGPPFRDLEVGA